MSRWSVCLIAIALAIATSGAQAQSGKKSGAGDVDPKVVFLATSTRSATALISKLMKSTSANVAVNAMFVKSAVSYTSNSLQLKAATSTDSTLKKLYYRESKAIKASRLSTADKRIVNAALKAAYSSASTKDASSANAANSVVIKNSNGDGGMRTVSFRISSDQLTALRSGSTTNSQGGTTATSLEGLKAYWGGVVRKDLADATDNFSTYFVTAFGAAMSADTALGCKALTGYTTSGGTPVGC